MPMLAMVPNIATRMICLISTVTTGTWLSSYTRRLTNSVLASYWLDQWAQLVHVTAEEKQAAM